MTAKSRKQSAEELARRKRIAANMRAARDHAGIQQNEAAKAFDVDPTTVYRWERKGVIPRSKWAAIERVYNTTQGAIERGELVGGNGASSEPPYPAWQDFKEWLQTAAIRKQVEPWMLDSLRRIPFPPSNPPRRSTYRSILAAYLEMDDDTHNT